MKKTPKRPARMPWDKDFNELSKYDWLTAVGMSDAHKMFARDLRIANVLMQKADAKTNLCWATQETLAQLAGLGNDRQAREALQHLEDSGALKRERIADLQPDTLEALGAKMAGNRNRRGSTYRLKLFWAYEIFEARLKKVALEPDHLRENRERKRTTVVRSDRTTAVRFEADYGSPPYTTEKTNTDTMKKGQERRNQDLASTRESNLYAKAKGRAA